MSASDIMISTREAAQLIGIQKSEMQRRIINGKLEARTISGLNIGQGGISYAIPLSELSIDERIKYYEMQAHPDVPMEANLLEYRGRFKTEADADDAINELFRRQQAVLAVQGIRAANGRNVREEMQAVADKYGVSTRGLYRWEDAYLAQGLAGLMRKARADKGESRTMCAEAKRFIYEQYLHPAKRSQAAIMDKLLDRAAELGPKGCKNCPYNPESRLHYSLQLTEDAEFFPPCDRAGSGMIPPESRYAVGRIISAITPEELTYMRKGRKVWEADFMVKATRKKPDTVNEAWYGDHHQFDLFCIDENGKLCRPWLTAWHDIASGGLIGWCISKNPNSETITESFIRAVMKSPNSPFWGAPVTAYMDNGKDYRGRRFEGGEKVGRALAELNGTLMQSGLLKALHVQAIHAKPYHGWVKPIERFFKTLEERYCADLPGYCGGKPDDRPENFTRQLQVMHRRGELLTLDELADTFINEMLPAFHNRPHSGYGGETPMERYMRLPKAREEVIDGRTVAIYASESSTRKVSTQGITFENVLYWHPELRHRVGEVVTLRYLRGDKSSLTVCDRNGSYICEAEPKEYMRHVGEDEIKVAKHVALQRQQEKEVRRSIRARGVRMPGKRASGLMFYEQVDERVRGSLIDLEAERAARGKEESRQRRREREQRSDEGMNRVRSMMIAAGEKLVSGSK